MRVLRSLATGWLPGLLMAAAAPAQAASYDFPSAMPAGCSGSNGSYTCTISSLAFGDTVTVSGTRPATVTVTGNLALNSARINQGGSASDLTLVVQGRLTPGFQAVVNANVTAAEVLDADGQVSFGGTLRATAGPITLGYRTSVAGAITASNDAVTVDNEAVAGSSISAGRTVSIGYRSQVAGAITATEDVTIGQEAVVAGAIVVTNNGNRNVSVGYAATVRGDITTNNGSITLAQNAVAQACLRVGNTSRSITLGLTSRAGSVCCGTVGSCSTSCVGNNSTYALPPACSLPATLIAKYDFNESSYNKATNELKDTAGYTGGPYNGQAQGSSVPTTATASPARSTSAGTCGYATLPGLTSNGGGFITNTMPVVTTTGAKTTVAFWMYWDGTTSVMPIGWGSHDLWLNGGHFGFNTANSDIYGIGSTGLSGVWRHVVAVFTNGSVTGNRIYIDGVLQTLTQRMSSPSNTSAVVSTQLRISGWGRDTSYRMIGRIDQVRVYNGEVNASQVAALVAETSNCAATSWNLALDYLQNTNPNGAWTYGSVNSTGNAFARLDWNTGTSSYGIAYPATGYLSNGYVYKNTTAGTAYGIEAGQVSLESDWGNAAVRWTAPAAGSYAFTINVGGSLVNSGGGYGNNFAQYAAVKVNGTTLTSPALVSNVRSWSFTVNLAANDTVDTFVLNPGFANGGNTQTKIAVSKLTSQVLHRLQIEHASGTGLTCTPSTVTVKACADAACTTAYTSGVSGTLAATGGNVVWPDTTAFSIPAGSSTTTVRLQAATTTATVLGVASSTPAASNAASCNFGSPACTFTAADAGFIFDVPNHVAEAAQSVSVSAVRKSDNSPACTPAFASTSKAVTFRCSYTNPATGTLPVRVGGSALNSGGSAAAACDAGGRAVTLAFNASGMATTAVQYADVGQLALTAAYTGSAGTGDTGLAMSGSDSFIAAPGGLTFSGITSGPIKAGSSFAATVSAVNSASATTPNYGRETSPEGATLAWVRIQPTGSGAVNGSFSGSLGAFSGGSASASNLTWTEVGRGDLVVRSTNTAGYLGTGLRAFGASTGTSPVDCAAENANCVIPGGTTATVYYGENGSYFAKAGQTGTVACNGTTFGDPLPGTSKRCWYVAATTTGSVGDVIPHRFTVAANHACGTFSYAGQPITTTVTARNAAGNTTVNFNGTATTTPAFAQAVTLTDANSLGLGSLSGHTIAAGAFSAGVASATPSYSFTSKTTAPQSLVLRATNGASGIALISSSGYAEPTLPLRSGRLRLANAFGQATAALQVPVVAESWGGSAWQLNSADSCTTLAGASVALGNPRGATGAASTATSSAGAVAISSGSGSLTLAAPSPAGSSLSLDLAVNLGSTGTDQSCNSVHPATTGAGLPWLRAQNGSCAATADRDPAARASFGIFAPETRKTVHVRDVY